MVNGRFSGRFRATCPSVKNTTLKATRTVYPVICQVVNTIPAQFIAETAQALLDAARLQIAQRGNRVVEEKAHFYTRPVVLRRVGDLPALRGLRAAALYREDEAMTLRKSHENPVVKELYESYLGEPGSHLAHHILHTTYVKRGLYGKVK